MEQLTIYINQELFIIKQSFRALLMFEELSKKNISQMNESIADVLLLFYCMLKAGNKDLFKYSYDEFIDVVDANPDTLTVFTKYLESQAPEEVTTKKKVAKKN